MEDNKSNALVEIIKNSTPEQRYEAEAIFRFMSKLKSTQPEAKIEEQLEALEVYFSGSEASYNIKQPAPHVIAFIEKICKEYYDNNKDIFSNLEEKNPIALIVSIVLASSVFKGDDTEDNKKVYSLYQNYLEDYINYVEGVIEKEGRYDLTINNEDVYKQYLKYKKDLEESEKERTVAQAAITFPEYANKNLAAIKDFIEAGLDSRTTSRLITDVLIKRYLLVSINLTTEPLVRLGPVDGMSDSASIQRMLACGERFINELELSETQAKLVKQAGDRLQYLIPINTPKSGCLGILVSIIGLSVSVLAALGYGISQLFA